MTSTTDLIDSAIWSLSLDDKIKVWELIEQLVKESQLPQTEISDEEIDKKAKEFFPMNDSDVEMTKKAIWKLGAKWYREQLKQPKKD